MSTIAGSATHKKMLVKDDFRKGTLLFALAFAVFLLSLAVSAATNLPAEKLAPGTSILL